MKTFHFVVSAFILFGLFSLANAACSCECVNGQVQAICDNAMDMQPICPPRLCPMTTPDLAPLQMPSLPPLGTSKCQQEQVYNSMTGRYEYKEICR